MKRTLLTQAQIKAKAKDLPRTLIHKWSTRGYGNSKFLDNRGNVIARASGCGYDRRGTALGKILMDFFSDEIYKLAERTRDKKARPTYQGSTEYYGLFFNNKLKNAWVDGGCGWDCMIAILNRIGFTLEWQYDNEQTYTGEQVYLLRPLTKQERKYIR